MSEFDNSQKCFIYAIRNKNTPKIYVGSTVQPLKYRFSCHMSKFKTYLKGHYVENVSSFEVLCGLEPYIELLEEFEYQEKKQIFEKELHYINLFSENCVNKNKPSRTQTQWKLDNQKYYQEYLQSWRKNNPDYFKEWRKNNPDYVKIKKEQGYYKEKSESFSKKNPDYYKNYMKEYYHRKKAQKLEELQKQIKPLTPTKIIQLPEDLQEIN